MMGKTNQRLRIWVHRRWIEDAHIATLREKGHDIQVMTDATDPDLILHPTAWRWSDKMWDYLDVVLKEARKARKGAAA